ncbi:MAG: outer membrane protein transport protein [Verrucomicrobiota bacterium]|nr:outer membrane protein transport protein [Verrucomicrobiota bacterium]
MRSSFRIFWCCLLALPLLAKAGSFSLSEQSVSGLGTAYAGGAAQAEDASTLFFNPAGIVLLEQGELQLAAHVISPSAKFTNQGSQYLTLPITGLPISGGNDGDAGVTKVLPNFYLTQPVFRNTRYGDLSVGVGVSVPFGLETHYDAGWVGRYEALRTKLTIFDIQPTIAYRLFDRISFGASLDIQRASATLTQALDFGLAFRQPGALDGFSEVKGDDWSVGYTLGALLEYMKGSENSFLQEGRFGVSYRAGIDHTLEGHADFHSVPAPFTGVYFDQNAKAQLDLPDILHFSVYQRFARQFAVVADLAWTRWSRLQNVPITFQNPATSANVLVINYDDANRYALGFEYYATKSLTLRTGFAYDETPIQSAELRTPRIPDSNRYFLSAGLGWKATRWMDLDVGYAHLFVQDPEVDVTDNQGHNLRGVYDASVDIVSASVTFRWGGQREVAPLAEKDSKDVAGYRK